MNIKYVYILIIFLYTALNIFANPLKIKVFYYDRPPYYGNVNGKPEGVLVDIAKEIFDEAGIKYEFVDTPSIRVLETLKIPENSCALGWFKTKEREAIYTYSDDFIYQDKPYSIINNKKRKVLSENPKIKEILESRLVLGMVERYVYGEWLNENILKFKPKTNRTNIGENSNLMYKLMILGNRFDYMFAGMEESSYAIKNNPQYRKKLSVVQIADAPNGSMRYILFSKGVDKTILEKINVAIKKVKTTDKYKQIILKEKTED